MRRRRVLAQIGASAIVPAVANAQQPGRTYRVGFLTFNARRYSVVGAVIDELRAQGFVEGNNLTVDDRGFNLRGDEFAAAAREMVLAKVDVLVCLSGGASVHGGQAATTTIPIVGIADDMVQEGLVGSLANRGGNTTGVSILGVELDGKRQELLMEMLPKARRLAVLADAAVQTQAQFGALQEAARAGGVTLAIQRIEKPEAISAALEAAKAQGAEAINVLASPLLNAGRQTIFAKATALGLPTVFQWPEGIQDGAVLAYGPGQIETFRQMGRLVAKVLRGAKPSELPVEQPTKFALSVNLKLARELGLAVPPALLQRADEVLE